VACNGATQGRCAAVLMFRHQLAILPAMGLDADELVLEEQAAAEGVTTAATVGNSYVINLAKMGIKEVLDLISLAWGACFLVELRGFQGLGFRVWGLGFWVEPHW
jgi:hypothetical protein